MASAVAIVTVDDCVSPRRVPSAKVPGRRGRGAGGAPDAAETVVATARSSPNYRRSTTLSSPVRPFVVCPGLREFAEANEQVQVEVLTFERATSLVLSVVDGGQFDGE